MKRVLVLPGGGMRGYVQAMAVADIEDRLLLPSKDVFDLIVGTSTGGILALGLASGIPARKIVEFYAQDGPNIFSRSWWRRVFQKHGLRSPRYKSDNLRAALEARFGDTRLGETSTRALITSYNWTRATEVLFKSWKPEFAGNTLVDVALATSAAPTYFPPHRLNGGDFMLDGGVFANNPASIAAAEARKLFPDDDVRMLIVENGHGNPQAPEDPTGYGLIQWAPHIIGVMMDGGYDVSTYIVGRLFGYSGIKAIWPPDTDVAMDDASPGAFRRMRLAYAQMHKWFMGESLYSWLGI